MAVFNPQVQPTQDPSYLNYSKATEAPEANKSTGLALQTLGAGLEGAVSVADTFIKSKIEDRAYKEIDRERDAQTTAYETLRSGQSVVPAPVQTPQGAKTASADSLMNANAAMDVPTGVETGIARIGTIAEAQAQNGGGGSKVNDTYYTSNISSIAKMLRAEYPGYRPYIDQEISKITGVNPANAYMQNLLQDINQNLSGSKQQVNHVLGELSKMAVAGNESAAEVYASVSKTGDINGALSWMARVNKNKWQAQEDLTNFTNGQNNRIKTIQNAESAWTQRAGNVVDEAFSAAQVASGITTPQKIAEYVGFEGLNPNINGTDSQIQAQALQAHRDRAEAKLRAQMNAPMKVQQADGSIKTETYASIIGAEKAEVILQQQLKPYDSVINAITNGKTGTATFAATVGKQYEDSIRAGIQTNPKTQQLAKLSVMSSMFGNNFSNIVTTEVLKNDAAAEVKYTLGKQSMDAFVQPDLKNKGLPSTFKDAIGEGKKNNIDPDTKYYDRLLDNINYLNRTDIPDAAKENMIYHFFHPKNIGVLNEFKPKYIAQNGVTIEGREAVFKALTTPGVTDSIAKLSKVNPTLGSYYKNWAEIDFGQNLFSKNIQDINQLVEEGRYEIHWDSNASQFQRITYQPPVIPNTPGYDKPATTSSELHLLAQEKKRVDRINESIETLNEGLGNMAQIEKSFGGNVNAYLLKTLENSGFKLSQWTKAIENSYGPAANIDPLFEEKK